MNYYHLNEDKTITKLPEGEYPKLGEFSESTKHVGNSFIGEQRVSTVFLHFDHGLNFGQEMGPFTPVLFESMIFLVIAGLGFTASEKFAKKE